MRGEKFRGDEGIFFPKILGSENFVIEETTEDLMSVSSKLGDLLSKSFLGSRVVGR